MAERERQVLLVGTDEEGLMTLAEGCIRAGYPYLFRHAVDGPAAMEALVLEVPDMMVADLESLGPRPLHFLLHLRGKYPQVPVGITAEASPDPLARELDEGMVILKRTPHNPEELASLLEKLSGNFQRFVGRVADFHLIDYLQLLHMGRHSRRIFITRGKQEAEILFENGQLVHARYEGLEGEEAFHEIVAWPGGHMRSTDLPDTFPRTVHGNWVHLAMEGLRRLDERRHKEMLDASGKAGEHPLSVSLQDIPVVDPIQEPSASEPVSLLRSFSSQNLDPLVDSLLDGRIQVGELIYSDPLRRRYQVQVLPEGRPGWMDVFDHHGIPLQDPGVRAALAHWFQTWQGVGHRSLPEFLAMGDLVLPGGPGVYIVVTPGEGTTLSNLLAAGTLLDSIATMAAIHALMEAVSPLHAMGRVHGSLNPDEVLVRQGSSPTDVEVGLRDPGLYEKLRQTLGNRMDQPWTLLGSPAYLSPEQLAGERHVGPPADVYALGVIIHEMMSGTLPFSHSSQHEIIAAKLTEPAPEVALPRAPGRLRSGLESLVRQCLARNPADRPVSAEAVLRTLEGIERGASRQAHQEQAQPPQHTRTPMPQAPQRTRTPMPQTPQGRSRFAVQRLSTPLVVTGPGGRRTVMGPRAQRLGLPQTEAPIMEQDKGPSRFVIVMVLLVIGIFIAGLAAGILIPKFLEEPEPARPPVPAIHGTGEVNPGDSSPRWE